MKDFKDLQSLMESKGEVKTADALSIGYSNYDLKVFLEQNMIERVSRGVYGLVRKNEVEEKVEVKPVEAASAKEVEETKKNANVRELSYKAIGYIFKEQYNEAIENYRALMAIDPENGYWDFCLAHVYFLMKDYSASYEYLKNCSKKIPNHNVALSASLILSLMKEVIDVDQEVIDAFASNIDKTRITQIYKLKVVNQINKGNYARAKKNFYYYIKNDRLARKYYVGNQFLYSTLVAIVNELGLEPAVAEEQKESSIVVPEVEEKQVLANTILLNAIEDGDYDKACQLARDYEITGSKDIIITLINKLKEATLKGASTFNGRERVVATENVTVYDKSSVIEDTVSNGLDTVTVQEEQVVVKPVIEEKPVVVESKKETAEDKYNAYKEAMERFDFDGARSSLLQYDRMMKGDLKYRNVSYHFSRISRAKEEYEENPDKYIMRRERINTAMSLFYANKLDEALRVLDEIDASLDTLLLRAKIFVRLGNYDLARDILGKLDGCEEPDYYRNMAQLKYVDGAYSECLEYCFKYNECRPHRAVAIYLLMADCYEKMRKPSKAIKALRIANEINASNGVNKNFNSRIGLNEKRSEKNRVKRLSIANNTGYNVE